VQNSNLQIVEPTREQAIAYAWQIGRLNYRRRNTQKYIQKRIDEAHKVSRKVYIESTRRLGKSSELLAMFIEHCIQTPRWKSGFFAPVKDGLLDYIEKIINTTLEDCPKHMGIEFNAQRFTLNFKNGSSIIFRGSNNKQHRVRRGQEFNEAGIDEARDVDELDTLIDSVIMPALFSADGYLYITSTPADTRSHPLFRYRQQAEAEGWLIKQTIWDANMLDPNVYRMDLINEWKAETMKSIDGDDVWKREYECEWVVNKSRAAVPEWNSKYVRTIPKDPYYKFYQHYIAIDWGYKDFTAIGFGTYCFRDSVLQIEGELAFSGTEVRTDNIARLIDEHAKKIWGPEYSENTRMVSDSADPILINELNQFDGMNFVPGRKEHTLEAMLNQFRVMVNNGQIAVDNKCVMTIHCLANAIWDIHRKKLDQDVFARHFDHLMQLVYMTRIVDFETNPIPKDFMIDGMRLIELDFADKNKVTDSGEALQRAFAIR
jgi:hypothetical protein